MNKKIISKVISVTLLCSMFAYVTPVFGYTKKEMVYSKASSSGEVYKTIVSEHLENTEKSQVLNDLSDLINIENTKGDETFTQDGTKLIWQANGNDIFYQGETSKELPIKTEIKYELDDKEVSADQIKGKSGKVKVTINYTNNEKRNVLINGNSVDMYVPFVVVAGTIINNDKAENIEVTNGKVINDGSKTMIMGVAFPGLQESLNLSESDIEIPNSIEITLDAKDYEQKNIMSFASSRVFEENKFNFFDKTDELFDQVNQLGEASKQLVTGSNTLKDGTKQFAGKSEEFNAAMEKYADGVSTANSSYTKLNNGIATLNASADELEAGAAMVSGGVTELFSKVSAALAGLNAQQAALQSKAGALVQSTTALSEQAPAIAAALASNGIDPNLIVNQLTSSQDLLQTLSASSDTSTLASALTDGITQLQDGADKLYAGTQALNEGTEELASGSAQMKKGLSTLENSTNQLLDANGQLTDAARTIASGSEELAEGMAKFDQEGISKIVNTVNNKIKDVVERAKKLKDISDEYNSFTAINESDTGSVEFITVVDAINSDV